ncbi:major facilitator superfamily domain-containing protein [Syncephalis pseudoplumigaleata]|uniref:Major facilitator superfamily domain-containing protein n=1 Tax=Syncephalis pseudoplumigaleata TaxID=1712513 RepID=A0A4P9YVZ7_9FUNG|nr:major facilitator superfamily domain-containing protein [Syncephalis pseudoplumigaleata]|eukprot:RKP24084.1 major facilitator superfamily domain-containing protein [Syncephalis pseudoplumigaleata]
MAKLNQLISLACAVLGMLAAGTVNTFSLFGPQLARQLDYSQLQLSQVAGAANVAHYLSAPLVGAYVDRVGPHRSSFFAALLLFGGYYGMAMMCDNALFTTSYALAMVFAVMTGIGTTIACAVALLTVTHRLPAVYRGTAFGVVLGVFGLSACLFALLHGSLVSSAASYATEAHATPATLLLPPPPPPLLPPSPSPSIMVNEGDSFPFYENAEPASSWTVLLSDKDFIALWLVKCLAVGVGIMYINCVGSMVQPFAADKDAGLFATVGAQVAAFGAASGAGQLVVGCLSDHAVNTARLHRLWLLNGSILAMLLAQLGGFLVMNAGSLLVMSIANGLAFGALDVLLPTLASEMWDSALVGRSIGWLALAPAFGGQLFITLFGLVFDWHQPAASSLSPVGCEDIACYRDVFTITSAACTASLVVAVQLYRRRTQHAAVYLCADA